MRYHLTVSPFFVLYAGCKVLDNPRMPLARYKQAFLSKISAAQLARLFDLLPDVSFFIKDRKGRFVALSPLGYEYCGVKSERDALGKTDYAAYLKRLVADRPHASA